MTHLRVLGGFFSNMGDAVPLVYWNNKQFMKNRAKEVLTESETGWGCYLSRTKYDVHVCHIYIKW